MRHLKTIVAACCLMLMLTPAVAAGTVKVIYHLNEAGFAQALRTINFVNNHLGGDPSVGIVVLAQADGVFFLSTEARNDNGVGFSEAVADLQQRGVSFQVCGLSLSSRGIRPDQLIPGVKIVRSGVVELARLQAVEHFAYIRP